MMILNICNFVVISNEILGKPHGGKKKDDAFEINFML